MGFLSSDCSNFHSKILGNLGIFAMVLKIIVSIWKCIPHVITMDELQSA